MKILFVRSGNSGVDPISTNQGKSVSKLGCEIFFFDIIGKGWKGYLSNLRKLSHYIKAINPDLIHAHYSLSGFITSLTFSGIPTGVSLMGSDVNDSGKIMKLLIKFFSKYVWAFTIVKSAEMYNKLNSTKSVIISNGVDLEMFFPISIHLAREKLEWERDLHHILFASDPERPEKNYQLAEKAFGLLKTEQPNFKVHFLKHIDHSEMVYYYNAANVLLLTSFHEGSPNVIKEAMACNCPIITTDVGDVKSVLSNTKNVYLTSYSADEVKNRLLAIFSNTERTDGRSNINQLDSRLIAKQLLDLYQKALGND